MTTNIEFQIRNLDKTEIGAVKKILFQALDWNPSQPIPVSINEVMAHPQVIRYHVNWGRPGDIGVVATLNGRVVGGAYCRLFTDEDHGAGYFDSTTPELAIAVDAEHRGKGIGAQLLQSLEKLAKSFGYEQLSLSVHAENPAVQLYKRSGYRTINDNPEDFLMVKRL